MTSTQPLVQILGAVAVLLIVGLVVAFVTALVQVSRAEHLSYAAKSVWVVGLFLLPVIGMMAWFALKDHWR